MTCSTSFIPSLCDLCSPQTIFSSHSSTFAMGCHLSSLDDADVSTHATHEAKSSQNDSRRRKAGRTQPAPLRFRFGGVWLATEFRGARKNRLLLSLFQCPWTFPGGHYRHILSVEECGPTRWSPKSRRMSGECAQRRLSAKCL